MKTILIVLPNDNLGGAEQYLKMIAEYLHYKKMFSVDVFFLKRKTSGAWDQLENDNFRLHFTNSNTEKVGAISLSKYFIFCNKVKYEYAFTSHVHVNSFVSLFRKINVLDIKFHVARESTSIFTRYSGFKLFVFKMYYKFNYAFIDLLICQSDFMLNQFIQGMPRLSSKMNIKVIPNPVNLLNFNVGDNVFNNHYSNYIVSAGRFIPEKGFDILIESFFLLKKEIPELSLVILGEGKLRNQLEQKIIDLDLVEDVFLPGFVDNVYHYFQQAELCVVSSILEGFPNVLLQMMSQNTKVVSTLCAGGINELKGVVTCSVNDSDALFHSMKTTLTMDSVVNRSLFDKELHNRSVENFVRLIESHLLFD